MEWKNYNDFLFGQYGKPKFNDSLNLIMYDLDGTVIQPKGKVRPGAPYNKWEFVKGAKAHIQKDAQASNTLLVFVTNQLNLPRYADDFRKKIDEIMQELAKKINFSALFYAASGRSACRKPSTGIFSEHLLPLLKEKGVKNISRILYVGDAAGRAGDFNDTDRKYLYNLNLLLNSKLNPLDYGKIALFKTPEEYFQGKKVQAFKWGGINPKKIMDEVLKGKKPSELDTLLDDYFGDEEQEIILMVGLPASGKSTIAKRIAKDYGYKRVNQDEMKTKAKVYKAIRTYLRQGKSVVVDNTNLDPARRDEIIKIAQEHFANTERPVKIRAFYINGDWPLEKQIAFAKHLNTVRQRLDGPYINELVYRVMLKKFEPPTEAEGFTEIINIPFLPRFKNAEHVLAFLQRS